MHTIDGPRRLATVRGSVHEPIVGPGTHPSDGVRYGASARHFGHWLQSAKIAFAEVNENTVRRLAQHRYRCPGVRRDDRLSGKYVNRARRFVSFLAECGVVTPLTRGGSAAQFAGKPQDDDDGATGLP